MQVVYFPPVPGDSPEIADSRRLLDVAIQDPERFLEILAMQRGPKYAYPVPDSSGVIS
jgi:hypothetical protein